VGLKSEEWLSSLSEFKLLGLRYRAKSPNWGTDEDSGWQSLAKSNRKNNAKALISQSKSRLIRSFEAWNKAASKFTAGLAVTISLAHPLNR